MGKSSINGPFSMAMLNNQMVIPHEKTPTGRLVRAQFNDFKLFFTALGS